MYPTKLADSWLINGSGKRGLKEVNREARTKLGDILNIESGITLSLLQGLVKYSYILDCHSVNRYKEEEILSLLLRTTHPDYLVILT